MNHKIQAIVGLSHMLGIASNANRFVVPSGGEISHKINSKYLREERSTKEDEDVDNDDDDDDREEEEDDDDDDDREDESGEDNENGDGDFVTMMEDYLQQDQLSLRNAGAEPRLRLVILIQSFIFDVIVDDQNLSSVLINVEDVMKELSLLNQSPLGYSSSACYCNIT
ncbi:hypothetical protein D5086_007898 [Populus alba]|uniref:Uncharacterized protein n=1 Tax=Populus alba TaxID=43335 RepID=A0ACC4CEL0_POPAL